MISKEVLQSAKKYVSKNRLRAVFYDELIKNEIYNQRTGKPYSSEYIYMVLKGERENLEIEKVIINLINEMKQKREAIEKDYRENVLNQ